MVSKKQIPIDDLFSHEIIKTANDYLDVVNSKCIRVLEIGSGRNQRFKALRENNNILVFGAEIDLNEIKKAKITLDSFNICTDVEFLPFKYGSFDIIVSYSVLQYINWKNFVQECSKLLKKDGQFLFIETLAGNPFAKIYRSLHSLLGFSYKRYLSPKKHISVNDLKEFPSFFNTQYLFYHLTTPLVLLKSAFQKAYKKTMTVKSEYSFNKLQSLDKFLLSKFPKLNNLCWFVMIYGKKIT